jgi:colanic acid biosynthesis glycosyl transferase WcaI
MRILYLTQWFEPEPAFKGAGFADELAARGHLVEVATGFPNYPGGRLYPGFRLRPYRRDETPGGVRVHRLFLYPSHDRSAVGRALNYISFFFSCLVFCLLRGRHFDVIYVYHPPITPSLAAALVARLYRVRLVVELQDLWPDSVGASGMVPASVTRLLSGICDFVYRRAYHVVVQSKGMRQALIERGIPAEKVTRIYNWASYSPAQDTEDIPEPPQFKGHVNVVYGGNIGQAQALEYVVEAMEAARRMVPALRLHLFGDGIEREALKRMAASRPGADVVFHPPVPRKQMDRIFDQADILVMHLNRDPLYEFTIPSKMQHYLACGKPIVAGIAGEAGDILERSRAAFVCVPEDSEGLATGLVKAGRMEAAERAAMGRRARAFYERNFSMAAALERTLRLLGGTAASGCAHRDAEAAVRPAQGGPR